MCLHRTNLEGVYYIMSLKAKPAVNEALNSLNRPKSNFPENQNLINHLGRHSAGNGFVYIFIWFSFEGFVNANI